VLLLVSLTTHHYNSAVMLDWSLVLAIATFSLAGAAFWAIWQNYIFRKEDRELQVKVKVLDEVTEWARKARETILDSLAEYWTYQKEVRSSLIAEEANLQAQLKTLKSRQGTAKNKAELIKLEKELEILRGERLTEDDYKVRVLSLLKDVMAEHDFLMKMADQFGEGFQLSIQRVDQSLSKVIARQYPDSELHPDQSLISECTSALNQLALDATSIKSLLLRYGSKLKL